jgi:hypothetical protein
MPPEHDEIESLRDQGRALRDQGFMEINLISGYFTWANEFALNRYGITLEQLQKLTIFDLVPEEFHDDARNMVSDQTNGKFHKFSIWPGKSPAGQLIWWYSIRVKADSPFYWFKIEYLNTTDGHGPSYSSMRAAMETTNSYNDLYNRFTELKGWTEDNVHRLEQETAETRDMIDGIREQMRSCLAAANRAANAALENAHTINTLKQDISSELSNHTTEIIKLITTDSVHGQRMEAFNGHMKEVEKHVEEEFEKHIRTTTSQAMNSIRAQAEDSGKGLTKKITIPVGVITAIASIIQWMVQHWLK